MAITTVNGLIGAGRQNVYFNKGSMTNAAVVGVPISTWNMTGTPGAGTLSAGNTTTGTTFTDATTGAPIFTNPSGGNYSYISRIELNATQVGTWYLFDRVWGAGALTPSNTTYTSLASGTLSSDRIGDGGDCQIWFEIVSALGAATYAQTVNYTDADDQARSTTTTINQTALPLMVPAQMSGRGCKAITSMSGGTTGTGTFNVLIMRYLASATVSIANTAAILDFTQTGMPRVYDDTCFFWAWQASAATEPTFWANIQLAQG